MASRINIKKMYKQMSEDYRMLLAQHQEMRREYKALKKENEKIRKENEEPEAPPDPYTTTPTRPPSRKMTKRRKKTDRLQERGRSFREGDAAQAPGRPARAQGHDQQTHSH